MSSVHPVSAYSAQVALNCVMCNSTINLWECRTCEYVFCSICRALHDAKYQTHFFVRISNSLIPNSQIKRNQTIQFNCIKHMDGVLRMFCKNCDKMVCATCIGGADHTGHVFATFEDIYLEKKNQLQDYKTNIETKTTVNKHTLDYCNLASVRVSNERQQNFERAKERYEKLKTALEKAMRQLEDQFGFTEMMQRRPLNDVTDALERAIRDGQDFGKQCIEKLEAPQAEMLHFLPVAKQMQKRIKQSFQCPKVPKCILQVNDADADAEMQRLLGFLYIDDSQGDFDCPPPSEERGEI